MATSARRALVIGFAVFLFPGCGGGTLPASPSPIPTVPFSLSDLRIGTGTEASNGMMVTIYYTAWRYDPSRTDQKGDMFATNAGGRFTFPFFLGAGQVIRAWDMGIVGMKEGGLRRLWVPPDLAHGGRGMPAIPANSTLVFEIELHEAFWLD